MLSPMRHLVFRVPTQLQLASEYALTETITLRPAGPTCFHVGGAQWNACSFWFDQVVADFSPPAVTEDLGTLIRNEFNDLRDFILLWTFVTDDGLGARAFEVGDEGPTYKTGAPAEDGAVHPGGTPKIVDAASLHPRIGPRVSPRAVALADMFERYRAADPALRDWIGLATCAPNRYIKASRRLYDNFALDASLQWTILDALAPADHCRSNASCGMGCTDPDGKPHRATISHVKESFRQRMHRLLEGFADRDLYVEIVDRFRQVRSAVLHTAENAPMPATEMPERDLATGRGLRSVTYQDAIRDFRTEGLATEQAVVVLKHVTHCLLLNRLVPELEFWPPAMRLHLVSATIGGAQAI